MAIQFSTTASGDAFWIATPVNTIGSNQSTMSVFFAFEVNQVLPGTSLWIFTQGSSITVPFKIEVAQSGSSGENFVYCYFQGPSGSAQGSKQFTSNSPHFLGMVWTAGARASISTEP